VSWNLRVDFSTQKLRKESFQVRSPNKMELKALVRFSQRACIGLGGRLKPLFKDLCE
jgi:hypothetical protein